MPKLSAGIMLYRHTEAGIEVLLAHPGGPFWASKDDGVWSIPKGHVEPDEDAEIAARREFAEETGMAPPGTLTPLGEFKQPGGKIVIAFSAEGDFEPDRLASNTFELEWPPRSGEKRSFPEVDQVGWFNPAAARSKLLGGQIPILEALLKSLP